MSDLCVVNFNSHRYGNVGCYLGTVSASSYDVICIVDPVQVTKLDLPVILHILRPNGILLILQLIVQADESPKPVVDGVISALTLGGFVKPHTEVSSAANRKTCGY